MLTVRRVVVAHCASRPVAMYEDTKKKGSVTEMGRVHLIMSENSPDLFVLP